MNGMHKDPESRALSVAGWIMVAAAMFMALIVLAVALGSSIGKAIGPPPVIPPASTADTIAPPAHGYGDGSYLVPPCQPLFEICAE